MKIQLMLFSYFSESSNRTQHNDKNKNNNTTTNNNNNNATQHNNNTTILTTIQQYNNTTTTTCHMTELSLLAANSWMLLGIRRMYSLLERIFDRSAHLPTISMARHMMSEESHGRYSLFFLISIHHIINYLHVRIRLSPLSQTWGRVTEISH